MMTFILNFGYHSKVNYFQTYPSFYVKKLIIFFIKKTLKANYIQLFCIVVEYVFTLNSKRAY